MKSRKTDKPLCRKCGKKPCQWYGVIGGYSVQCLKCNEIAAAKRRERYARRQGYPSDAEVAKMLRNIANLIDPKW